MKNEKLESDGNMRIASCFIVIVMLLWNATTLAEKSIFEEAFIPGNTISSSFSIRMADNAEYAIMSALIDENTQVDYGESVRAYAAVSRILSAIKHMKIDIDICKTNDGFNLKVEKPLMNASVNPFCIEVETVDDGAYIKCSLLEGMVFTINYEDAKVFVDELALIAKEWLYEIDPSGVIWDYIDGVIQSNFYITTEKIRDISFHEYAPHTYKVIQSFPNETLNNTVYQKEGVMKEYRIPKAFLSNIILAAQEDVSMIIDRVAVFLAEFPHVFDFEIFEVVNKLLPEEIILEVVMNEEAVVKKVEILIKFDAIAEIGEIELSVDLSLMEKLYFLLDIDDFVKIEGIFMMPQKYSIDQTSDHENGSSNSTEFNWLSSIMQKYETSTTNGTDDISEKDNWLKGLQEKYAQDLDDNSCPIDNNGLVEQKEKMVYTLSCNIEIMDVMNTSVKAELIYSAEELPSAEITVLWDIEGSDDALEAKTILAILNELYFYGEIRTDAHVSSMDKENAIHLDSILTVQNIIIDIVAGK